MRTYDQQSLQQVSYGKELDDVYEVSPDGTGDGAIGNPAPLDQVMLDNIHSEFNNSLNAGAYII